MEAVARQGVLHFNNLHIGADKVSGTTKVLHERQQKKALLPTEKDAKDELHYYEVTRQVFNLPDGSAPAEDLENHESDSTVGSMDSIIFTVGEISKTSHYTPTYVHNSKGLYRSRNTCTRIDRLCMTPRKKKRLVGHGSARKLFVIMHACMCALCHYRQRLCDCHAYHERIQVTSDAPTGEPGCHLGLGSRIERIGSTISLDAKQNSTLIRDFIFMVLVWHCDSYKDSENENENIYLCMCLKNSAAIYSYLQKRSTKMGQKGAMHYLSWRDAISIPLNEDDA